MSLDKQQQGRRVRCPSSVGELQNGTGAVADCVKAVESHGEQLYLSVD